MITFRIFTILFPIFSIITIGYIYARLKSIDMTMANRLIIEILSPALIFSVLSKQSVTMLDYYPLALGALLILLGSGLLVLPFIYFMDICPKTFLPSMMFPNTGNIGIPVALFAFGEVGLPTAVLFLIITASLNFTLGMYIVSNEVRWWNFFKCPIIQATLAGLIVNEMQLKIPELLLTTLEMLGTCAIPMMLLSLGVRLNQIDLTYWRMGLLGALLRPLTGFIMFLLLYPWLTLNPTQKGGLLLFAMLPPAIINYIIAEQYQQEPHKVAAIVMMGNLASFISLPIALALALPST